MGESESTAFVIVLALGYVCRDDTLAVSMLCLAIPQFLGRIFIRAVS